MAPGRVMKTHVIEREGASWVLRLFGRQDAMISGPTVESAKKQASSTRVSGRRGELRLWDEKTPLRESGAGSYRWRLSSAGLVNNGRCLFFVSSPR